MASCVAWGVKDPHLELPIVPSVAIFEADVNPRNAILVCGGPHNGRTIPLLQLQVAAGVIKMVVCIENVVRFQTPA